MYYLKLVDRESWFGWQSLIVDKRSDAFAYPTLVEDEAAVHRWNHLAKVKGDYTFVIDDDFPPPDA